MFRQAPASVPSHHGDIGQTQAGQIIRRLPRQLFMTLHRLNVLGELSQQGSLISRAGSDLQHFRRGLQMEKVQHQGNDVGLRNRLTRSDGKRMVFIGLVAVARLHKLVTRDRRHRIEQALVADAASSHLGLHHVLAFDREAIGLEIGNGQKHRCGGLSDYFLRCRIRTSMLTTPFWSRTPTMETLRVMLYSAWMICCDAWATLVV